MYLFKTLFITVVFLFSVNTYAEETSYIEDISAERSGITAEETHQMNISGIIFNIPTRADQWLLTGSRISLTTLDGRTGVLERRYLGVENMADLHVYQEKLYINESLVKIWYSLVNQNNRFKGYFFSSLI